MDYTSRTEKEIEVLFEENKLISTEIIEYTKLIFLIVSIFLVFSGTSFTLGFAGHIEAWLFLQVMTPFFLVMLTTLEKENKFNSIYMIYNEKRINYILDKNLLHWQYFIGSGYIYENTKFDRFKFLWTPIMISLFLFLVYLVPVYYIGNSIKDNWQISNTIFFMNIFYILFSIIAYLLISIILLKNRKIGINNILCLIEEIKSESFFN